MAYATKDLRLVDVFPIITTGGVNPGLYLHNTADSAATVIGAGYFNNAADRLVVGSVILSVTSTGTTPVLTTRTVTANTGTVVTIV
jgi:hypothetical protein